MYTVRDIVTDADMKQVREMWKKHSRLMRTYVEEPASFTGGTIVGAFDANDELAGTLRHYSWGGTPFYSIGSLYIRPGLLERYDFSLPDNPIPPILDSIIELKEEQQFYSWYYTRAMGPGYAKLQESGKDLLSWTKLGKRYERFVNEIVRPGTRSKIPAHDSLLTERIWSKPIMVVHCVLRNEFRPFGDALVNEMKLL